MIMLIERKGFCVVGLDTNFAILVIMSKKPNSLMRVEIRFDLFQCKKSKETKRNTFFLFEKKKTILILNNKTIII